jgi:hypothetical protein
VGFEDFEDCEDCGDFDDDEVGMDIFSGARSNVLISSL